MGFRLGSVLLNACVLAILTQNDAYGYVLTQNVRKVIEISESTLYPVLRRLQKSGLLTTYDMPYQGRNRRYYKITEAGKQALKAYRDEWQRYKQKVEKVLLNSDERDDKNE